MIPPNDYGYSQDSNSDPLHAYDYFDQSLEVTQSSSSSDHSIGGRSERPSFAAASDPTWFTDWILYTPDDESNDPDIQADPVCVSSTHGSVRMDLSRDIATIAPMASSPGSVPMSADISVPNDIDFDRGPYPTELDDADYVVLFGSNMPDSPWNWTEQALDLSASSLPKSPSSAELEQSLLEDSKSAQNDTSNKLSVPRIHYFKCPTCPSQYLSELRLRFVSQSTTTVIFLLTACSEHLRGSHALAQFTCITCDRVFKLEKDLKRHYSTHEPLKRSFACSCTRTYSRYDGLLRHFNNVAKRSREAGHHKAVELNPR